MTGYLLLGGEVGTCIGAENTERATRGSEEKSRPNSHRLSEILHPPPENKPKTSSKGAPVISGSVLDRHWQLQRLRLKKLSNVGLMQFTRYTQKTEHDALGLGGASSVPQTTGVSTSLWTSPQQ